MNQVNIIGRLGEDVDLRHTTTPQRAIARMPVAVNDRYGKNHRVYWFSVICWNGLAETVSACPHTGSRITRRHIISDINVENAILISGDSVFSSYGVGLLWQAGPPLENTDLS